MRSGRLSIANARRNDEVGRTDESLQAGAHDLGGRCYEVRGQAMSFFNETPLKSMSRGGVRGRTCLMFIVTRVV